MTSAYVYLAVYISVVIGFALGYIVCALLSANRHDRDCQVCERVRTAGRVEGVNYWA